MPGAAFKCLAISVKLFGSLGGKKEGGGALAAFHDPICRDIKQRPPGNRLVSSSSLSAPTPNTDRAL